MREWSRSRILLLMASWQFGLAVLGAHRTRMKVRDGFSIQRNILYIVTGRKTVDEACLSSTSVKKCMLDISITMFFGCTH